VEGGLFKASQRPAGNRALFKRARSSLKNKLRKKLVKKTGKLRKIRGWLAYRFDDERFEATFLLHD
jgi:hypothetical protein